MRKIISSGQTSSGLIVGNNSLLVVFSGGRVTATQVDAGGSLIISGGIARLTSLHSGREVVSAGGESISAAVSVGSDEIIRSGGEAIHATVDSGGKQIVSSGGTVVGTAVSSGGTQIVYGGGLARGSIMGDHGLELVGSAGVTTNTTVESGGELELRSGGDASGLTVLAGGELLYAGGSINSLKIDSGGSAVLIAQAEGLVVTSGASVIISKGGVASDTKVLKGGTLVYAGGTAVGTVVSSGGNLGVAGGTTVSDLTVEKGATLYVSAGATAIDTTLNGGTEFVEDGGAIAGVQHFGGNAGLSIAAKESLNLSISGFSSTDILDFSGYSVNKSKVSFKEDPSKSFGTLTLTSGSFSTTIKLFGQYMAAGFQHSPDPFGGGTEILYTIRTATPGVLAHGHG
jgi:autotransporter passenger strand-loop-strand repeat protein